MVSSGLMIGIMLARPVSSFIAAQSSWRVVFGLAAAAMVMLAAALSRSLPTRMPRTKMTYGELMGSMIHLVRGTPVLRRRAFYQGCLFFAFSLFWTTTPLLLAGPHYGLTQNGIALFALAGVSGAIAAPIAGRAADRGWGRPATGAAIALERGGADCLVLCTNTMHKVAGPIAAAVGIPLLHIADATATAIEAAGLRRVGLLGTRFTMEEDFYVGRLAAGGNLEVLVPDASDRSIVNRIIYEELCLGSVLDGSRAEYLRIIGKLIARGAEGIVLGCTEIMMLIGSSDVGVPMFDTTTLHANAAVDFALAGVAAASDSPRGTRLY